MNLLTEKEAETFALNRQMRTREMEHAHPGCLWRCQIGTYSIETRTFMHDGTRHTVRGERIFTLRAFGPTWAQAVAAIEGTR
jgi:hypothetical protein